MNNDIFVTVSYRLVYGEAICGFFVHFTNCDKIKKKNCDSKKKNASDNSKKYNKGVLKFYQKK